ncbi:MAG: [protein-PII] uridylyltransferase family protein, partial [Burkholderiales bacterium]
SLKNEILSMRQKMLEGHPNRSDLFDIKHDPGGIVDVEFAVQFLVLAHAHDHPELTGNVGNIGLLGMLGEIGLIPAEIGSSAQDAYREFRRIQHRLRLAGETYARIERSRVGKEIDAVFRLWETVFG